MGNRIEPRVAMSLPVRVRGIDIQGNPFVQNARTIEVSRGGVCLQGLPAIKGPGVILEIDYRGRKARYQVSWIGQPGSKQEGQAGLRSLDPQTNIWGSDLPATRLDDHHSPAGAQEPSKDSIPISVTPAWTGKDRRRHPRYHCEGEVDVTVEGATIGSLERLSDISQGGCYLDTMAPLTVKTKVQMVIDAKGLKVHAKGLVLVSHPGMGMAIAFSEIDSENQRCLQELLARASGAAPPAAASSETPQAEKATAGGAASNGAFAFNPWDIPFLIQAVLELMERKGIFTRDELLESFERAKSSKHPQ